jgi:conjugative relaxase-like TrwC/TraI family protein
MFRMIPIEDAASAAGYFGKSDSGYFLDGAVEGEELRREWGGEDKERLGLTGKPTLEQFQRLLNGLDPHSGQQLTAQLVEDRVPGWAFTASVPKGVTTALECGDSRIRDALWEAGNEAMEDVQQYAKTRVRKGGMDADRITGNMLWLGVEHDDTRPTKEDGMPDWDRHLHFIVPNATWDDVEKEWKALKVRQIFDMKKWFDRRFDLRMSAKLVDLGYDIETKMQAGENGKRYRTWDIKAAPGHEKEWKSVNDKNSRRTREVEEAEKEAIAAIKEKEKAKGNADWDKLPDRLSKVARDKLGASSRQAKRKDLTLADCRAYWHSRLTPGEGRAVAETIKRAMLRQNPKPQDRAAKAMDYAIEHEFFRNSVVDWRDLAVTAMEKSMGAARPEDFTAEAWRRRGVLFQGDQASTQAVLDQEQRIIGFARAGKGTYRPLAPGKTDGLAGLSAEQAAAVRHVWNSTDRVMLVRGGAGTGKTTMMTPALAKLGAPVVLLAPSSDASRGQLRKEGFADANTVAAFVGQEDMQEKARGGIIWVDEAGLLPINDLERVCGLAKELDARIVLQGDPRQHKSVQRHGNMLTVLEEFAGLPVAKLTEIQRQEGDYAKAVAAIRDGDVKKGDAVLRKLGWVIEGRGHDALVAEYAKAIEEKKLTGERKTVLVIDPTHKDGDVLSQKLRQVRKAKGLIRGEEKPFPQLAALGWTDAQKADGGQYAGDEVIQFFRNSGQFKAGQRVEARQLVPQLAMVKPEHFAAYRAGEVNLAEGDTVRITGNGRDVTGKHRVDNGRIDTIRGFTPGGDMVLSNGWVIGKDFAHIKHGLVQTSPATQSKTDDIVLAAMNRASLGAMGAEQGYVTVSRGRERGMIFTDLAKDELLQAVARADGRMSATEVFRQRKPDAAPACAKPLRQGRPVPKGEHWMRAFMEKVRRTYRQLQRKAAAAKSPPRERKLGYAR